MKMLIVFVVFLQGIWSAEGLETSDGLQVLRTAIAQMEATEGFVFKGHYSRMENGAYMEDRDVLVAVMKDETDKAHACKMRIIEGDREREFFYSTITMEIDHRDSLIQIGNPRHNPGRNVMLLNRRLNLYNPNGFHQKTLDAIARGEAWIDEFSSEDESTWKIGVRFGSAAYAPMKYEEFGYTFYLDKHSLRAKEIQFIAVRDFGEGDLVKVETKLVIEEIDFNLPLVQKVIEAVEIPEGYELMSKSKCQRSKNKYQSAKSKEHFKS